MHKYNIPRNSVYRHFDVTGKACPGWNGWTGKNAPLWNDFLNRLGGTVAPEAQKQEPTNKGVPFIVQLLDDMNIRNAPNGTIVKKNGCKKGIKYTIVEVSGSWGKLKSGAGWICISDKYAKRC